MKLRCCLCGVLLGISTGVAAAPVGCNPLIEPVELRGEDSPRSNPVLIPRDMFARLPGFMVANEKPLAAVPDSELTPHLDQIVASAPVAVVDAPVAEGRTSPFTSSLHSVGIKLVNFAQTLGKGVKDIALTAGQFTIGKIAPLLGMDFNRASSRAGDINLVADVGMAQVGRPRYAGINSASPSLNAMLEREYQNSERAQAHSPGAFQLPGGKWEASATIGIDYKFE
ncbi:hypothetical protein HNQ59_002105 [Chitinivorax tropicus]|uniref:TonB-dependent receptor n=1 Tax=Chitinivorax tropicus TaxID=714531 RepID=A0A840MPY6_9PROT|nr:hypothetical protein [Chitinivorax tropicus]MBB5018812.1 hypothetical protein [Chitinivorax tropicus]